MSVQDVHLLVLIHGMWGNTSHLASMHRIIKETRIDNDPDGAELYVMLPETNQAESTYDGIDWGGERVAAEVSVGGIVCQIAWLSTLPQIFDQVEKLEKEGKRVTRFSVTGYSLGGLLARYVIG
jgi:dienelactone hydrolase